MILGIVGSQADKFTTETQNKARIAIHELFQKYHLGTMDSVCSGDCPNGGIDIWCMEEAGYCDINQIRVPPKELRWGGKEGYMARNKQIAKTSDVVVCITVHELPHDYQGMKFYNCYHHDDQENVEPHVKSGGCYTTKYARSLGKPSELIVIK